MSYSIEGFDVIDGDEYTKESKRLKKRFKNLDNDINGFLNGVKTNDDLGVPLGGDIYKARIVNSDKAKGKSKGYRLITLLKITKNELHLLYIYDKSDLVNVSEEDIDSFVKNIAL